MSLNWHALPSNQRLYFYKKTYLYYTLYAQL